MVMSFAAFTIHSTLPRTRSLALGFIQAKIETKKKEKNCITNKLKRQVSDE
jgi:hypothetical protein